MLHDYCDADAADPNVGDDDVRQDRQTRRND